MINIKSVILYLVLVISISGCSFRFVYNHLDWWVQWYLDDYVTLNQSQQRAFDTSFEQLHQWHRKSQLPLYIAQLEQLKLAINGQINQQQVIANLNQFIEHWQHFLGAVEPKLQPLAYKLSVAQRQQLITMLLKRNQEEVNDHDMLTEQAWLDNRAKQQAEQLKNWFGKLSTEQKNRVYQMSENFQQTFDQRMQYRKDWTHQFAELLNGDLPEHQFKFEFYQLIVNGRELRDESFKASRQNNNQVFAEIFVYMVASASDKQRKQINKKIDNVIDDLTYLHNDK